MALEVEERKVIIPMIRTLEKTSCVLAKPIHALGLIRDKLNEVIVEMNRRATLTPTDKDEGGTAECKAHRFYVSFTATHPDPDNPDEIAYVGQYDTSSYEEVREAYGLGKICELTIDVSAFGRGNFKLSTTTVIDDLDGVMMGTGESTLIFVVTQFDDSGSFLQLPVILASDGNIYVP